MSKRDHECASLGLGENGQRAAKIPKTARDSDVTASSAPSPANDVDQLRKRVGDSKQAPDDSTGAATAQDPTAVLSEKLKAETKRVEAAHRVADNLHFNRTQSLNKYSERLVKAEQAAQDNAAELDMCKTELAKVKIENLMYSVRERELAKLAAEAEKVREDNKALQELNLALKQVCKDLKQETKKQQAQIKELETSKERMKIARNEAALALMARMEADDPRRKLQAELGYNTKPELFRFMQFLVVHAEDKYKYPGEEFQIVCISEETITEEKDGSVYATTTHYYRRRDSHLGVWEQGEACKVRIKLEGKGANVFASLEAVPHNQDLADKLREVVVRDFPKACRMP